MKPKPLAIELLRIDGGTQSRLKINDDAVEDYAALLQGGVWPFPPLDVFHDGADYFVADGFHRLLAGLRAKRGSVPCNVHKGTATDARIFGMTANDRHGMRMTRADKRACVNWLLDNGGKLTQAQIAEKAGVGKRLVQMIVADRKPKVTPPKQPTPTAIKAQNALLQPEVGGDPFDDSADPFGEAPESPHMVPEPDSPDEPPGGTGGRGRAAQGPESPDYGKCPNCLGTKWDEDEDGVSCSKCHHPWGEATGGADEDQVKTQRQKTVKTVDALMRAFDDLNDLCARAGHKEAIRLCKLLLKTAKEWK